MSGVNYFFRHVHHLLTRWIPSKGRKFGGPRFKLVTGKIKEECFQFLGLPAIHSRRWDITRILCILSIMCIMNSLLGNL